MACIFFEKAYLFYDFGAELPLSVKDVLDKGQHINFPDSFKSFFRGDPGQPVGGFPAEVQKLELKEETPYSECPNAQLKPIDFDREFESFRKRFDKGMSWELELTDLVPYRLYPRIFKEAFEHHGNVLPLPTTNFFYGKRVGEEIMITIYSGKDLLIQLLIVGEPDVNGMVRLLFKVNDQMRHIQLGDRSRKFEKPAHRKA